MFSNLANASLGGIPGTFHLVRLVYLPVVSVFKKCCYFEFLWLILDRKYIYMDISLF